MLIDSQNQSELHINRQQQLSTSSKYISSFLSNLNPNESYQLNSCPTCGCTTSRELFTKNGGIYSYCQNCEHVFLSRSLKPEFLIDFYTNYPTSSLDWHQSESDFYQRIYNLGLDVIQASNRHGSLLDIGCSSGYFLSIAEQRGFMTYGIEPNAQESTFALDHGINIIGKTISDLPTDSSFDVITMWDVLEHLDSPLDFISSLKPHLNEGGLVFVQVPTCDSLAARILQSKCNMFDGIEHLTLFSRKSLHKVFNDSGFSLESEKSVISDSFALTNYLCYESDPYIPHSTHTGTSITNLIDFSAIEPNYYGYKIQACYKLLS